MYVLDLGSERIILLNTFCRSLLKQVKSGSQTPRSRRLKPSGTSTRKNYRWSSLPTGAASPAAWRTCSSRCSSTAHTSWMRSGSTSSPCSSTFLPTASSGEGPGSWWIPRSILAPWRCTLTRRAGNMAGSYGPYLAFYTGRWMRFVKHVRRLPINRTSRGIDPLTPKSDHFQISPAAKPDILRPTVWRIGLFIAYSEETKMIMTTNSYYLTYTFLFERLGKCTFWTWEWNI